MAKWLEHKAVHVTLVLIVFACTGLTVARIGAWLAELAGLERFSFLYWTMWIVVLLPVYNVILLVYAFIFGKFSYFRAKQRKTWSKVKGWLGMNGKKEGKGGE